MIRVRTCSFRSDDYGRWAFCPRLLTDTVLRHDNELVLFIGDQALNWHAEKEEEKKRLFSVNDGIFTTQNVKQKTDTSVSDFEVLHAGDTRSRFNSLERCCDHKVKVTLLCSILGETVFLKQSRIIYFLPIIAAFYP